MSENQDLDKSEEATPFKLQEAHKRGQVSKSMEVNSLVILLAFTCFILAVSERLGSQFVVQLRRLFLSAGQIAINDVGVVNWIGTAGMDTLQIFSPLFLVLIVVAVLATMFQTKPVLSAYPLKPDFKRLNPAQGFKKIFSMRTVYELIKTLLKLFGLAILLYVGISWLLSESIQLYSKNPHQVFKHLLSLFLFVAFAIIALFAPIAIFDYFYSKYEFAKKMRMSKREVKDEYKRREGHPEVKSKQKEVQRELLKKSKALGDVKDSDVIITNPTHFAVALKYDPETMLAPVVVAKGSGPIAIKIKQLAYKYRKPIVRKPRLARLLYKECNIDGFIPDRSYSEIAPIFRWVFAMKKGEV